MTFANDLTKLVDRAAYPSRGRVDIRWGQILREDPHIGVGMAEARQGGWLVALRELARIRSGVVTRANAFFLVRELPYEEVPERFNLTVRDYERVAVVEDGLKTRHRIERFCLRETIKGPEALRGPVSIVSSDERLFDSQGRSKDELREQGANGALSYLRRGESVDYRVSEDTLKRGIPAGRAQIKNRKPYWYSLHSPKAGSTRIAVPEHFDQRFLATLIRENHDAVVVDTLYSVEPLEGVDPLLLLASLNSLLTWYQLELRGRTQHGEGVLKVKIADWAGVLLVNPDRLNHEQRELLREAFSPLAGRDTLPVGDEVADPDRIAFDELYLKFCGAQDPAGLRIAVERELRDAMGERTERARSVDGAKALKAKVTKFTASVDAYATRVAGLLEPYPDPRAYLDKRAATELVLVASPWNGVLHIGEDLLNQGQILAGGQPIAQAGGLQAAHFVHAVLLHDPELTSVSVPSDEALDQTMRRWQEEVAAWRQRFEEAVIETVIGVADDRIKQQIRARALELLHAQ